MEGKNKKLLDDIGVDISGTMERFMQNEEMYFHFLRKFTENTQFEELVQALKKEDWDQALITSHNLKSLCGNLGLIQILGLLSNQVNLLRANDHEGAVAAMDDITKEQERIINLISDFDAR